MKSRQMRANTEFQNSTRLQITISLFYVGSKHPEEGSNADERRLIYTAIKRHFNNDIYF